jgi:glutamine synthetase
MSVPTLQEIRQLIDQRGIRRVDLKVTDLFGGWHHFAIPPERLNEALVQNGQGFDGSSLRGFQPIHESDMLLMPDLETAAVDPVSGTPTLSLICDVVDPITRERLSRDPRYIASKAEAYLRSSGVADEAQFGPELEFFIFDDVRFQQEGNTAFYYADSAEGHWNAGRDEAPNQGYKIGRQAGYSPVPPGDQTADVRWFIAEQLRSVGIQVEFDHHEVASGGQGEIGMRHQTLLLMADQVQWYKYLVRNGARVHGRVATFMPKPIHGDNGSGMHTHQSLWRRDTALFYDSNGYAGLSQLARNYMGGLLHHAPALLALSNPTTNSYRRLVPGYEAPVYLAYAMRNRSAAIRVPTYSMAPATKRIEFRPPDGLSNPYLAFSAMLMAGLDGIQRQLDPGDPLDRNLFELERHEAAQLRTVPHSLAGALEALEADHEFLLQGDVFTVDVLEAWARVKWDEVNEERSRPTPFEYVQYFNA